MRGPVASSRSIVSLKPEPVLRLYSSRRKRLPRERKRPALPRGNGEVILVVDDEPSIGRSCPNAGRIRRRCSRFGWRRGCVGILGARGGIPLVITDMLMPVMDELKRARVEAAEPSAANLAIVNDAEACCGSGSYAGLQRSFPSRCDAGAASGCAPGHRHRLRQRL